MATKLGLYNAALLHCKERKLATLTDSSEARRILDDVYDADFVSRCLEAGQWNFATRTVEIEYDSSITPSFGYRYAFTKPDDWVRTCAVSADEYFRTPLTRYLDEVDNWWCDLTTIYVRFVSDDASFGANLNIWPHSFTAWAEAELAFRIAPGLAGARDHIDRLEKLSKKLLKVAKANDAMNDPPGFSPTGSWVRARAGGGGRSDGGNRGSLTG